jgi:hypothetical protein
MMPKKKTVDETPTHIPTELENRPDLWVKLSTRIGHDVDGPVTPKAAVIGGQRRYHHWPLSTYDLGDGRSVTITTSPKEASAWMALKGSSNPAFPKIYDVVRLPGKLFAITHETLSWPVDEGWRLFVDTMFKWRAMEKGSLHPVTQQDMEDFLRFLIDPRLTDKKTIKKDRIEDIIPFDLAVGRRAEIDLVRKQLMNGSQLEDKIAWAKSALKLLGGLGIPFEDFDPSNLGKTKDGRTVIVNLGESGDAKADVPIMASTMLKTSQALNALLGEGGPDLTDYLFLSEEMRYILQMVVAHPYVRSTVEWMAEMAPRPSEEDLVRAKEYLNKGAQKHGERFAVLAEKFNKKYKPLKARKS